MRHIVGLTLVLLLLWASLAWAVLPDQASYDKLANDIQVNHLAEFQAMVAGNQWPEIAKAYNDFASPDFYVWRTSLTRKEMYGGTVVDAPPTQTKWSWGTFKAQTQQERDSWVEMMRDGVIDPSLSQTRDSYNVIFGGQGASLNQQNFLLALSRRKALRIEQLLATGPGTGTTAAPANLVYEGKVTQEDIAYSLGKGPHP